MATKAAPSQPPADLPARLEIYRMLVEMADRVSQRRQANNNFYLTVNTATVGASAYLATVHPVWAPTVVISVAGVAVCVAWGWSIESYRSLNQAKFTVIHEIEQGLPFKAFVEEWEQLTGGGPRRHTPFHRVEVVVPWVFGAIHAVQLLARVPWPAIWR